MLFIIIIKNLIIILQQVKLSFREDFGWWTMPYYYQVVEERLASQEE